MSGERTPVDAAGLLQAERTDGGPAVLVRPDGYIAWAGDSADRSGMGLRPSPLDGRVLQPAVLRGVSRLTPTRSANCTAE